MEKIIISEQVFPYYTRFIQDAVNELLQGEMKVYRKLHFMKLDRDILVNL